MDYSRSSDNYPLILDNHLEIVAQIDKHKKMHKYVRAEIEDFFSPRVLFT